MNRTAIHALVAMIALQAIASAGPVSAQTSAPAEISAALDRVAEQAGVTGYTLAAVENGSVAWTHASGVRSAVTNPPVTDETVFEAAALGKPVLGYIALHLADDGLLDLDRPLSEYAKYEDLEHDDRYLQVTARMVLMHGTGLPTWRAPGTRLEFEFDPGVAFSYSGEAFLFLQHVLERITLKPLDSMAREYVFGPLGMTSTSFVWDQAFEAHVAVGHDDLGAARDKFVPEMPNAAYSLHTTARDYARFLIAAGTGEGLSGNLASEIAMAQMDAGDGVYWGLGWGLQPTPGGMSIWQWGDTAGYKAFAYLAPDAETGFVYLSNSNNGMLLLHDIFEQVVGGATTAVDWLQYERVDDPSFALGREMIAAYSAGGLDSMMTRYEGARGDLPAEAYEEVSLNTLGYKFYRLGMFVEAIALFELNTRQYPRAYNAWDSLGEARLASGDLQGALEAYRRSVELNPQHRSGRLMVQRIEQQLASSSDGS